MISTAERSSVTPASLSQSESKTALETSFQAALEHARRLTQMCGTKATEVAVAWEVVEELAIAKRRKQDPFSAFERYCIAHPDAPECRIYDL
jgi:hypothetical protein